MSMENFFNWMSKPVPKDEVIIWFNVHNMNYEKIELFGDIFKGLNHIITDTYMGDDDGETKIYLTQEDKDKHFEWCWNKLISDFSSEKILIKKLLNLKLIMFGWFDNLKMNITLFIIMMDIFQELVT